MNAAEGAADVFRVTQAKIPCSSVSPRHQKRRSRSHTMPALRRERR
jgi:hypothetical protein